MKIGVLGGTFNPIHIGHLMLGEFSYESYHLDEIWFMPNSKPPHKSIDTISTTDDQRTEMIHLAIKDIPYFVLKDFEMRADKVYYSYETMERLKKEFPSYEFYFIVGSDSLFNIEKWMHVNRLFQTCSILVAYRENGYIKKLEEQIAYLKEKYTASIYQLNAPVLEISSSGIRSRVANYRSIKYLVPDAVRDYIKECNLYEKGM